MAGLMTVHTMGSLIMVVGVLVSVAFMILLERKVLSYIQTRKGPNKVSLIGLIQSFGDAVKLFISEQTYPVFSNMGLYYFAPLLAMFIMLMVWLIVPVEVGMMNMSFSLIYVFCCLGVGVYVLIYSGWSSNSNYALVGAIRGVAQTISYEVSLVFLLLCLLMPVSGFNIFEMMLSQEYLWLLFLMMPVMLGWVVTMLAESNRTPFDFSEGESELVSGFNIEYGSGGFAVLFLAEYGMIIFMSYLISFMFIGGESVVVMNTSGLFFCFFFLWVRGMLPRFRYDKLMGLVWKSILPASLGLLVLNSVIGVVV